MPMKRYKPEQIVNLLRQIEKSKKSQTREKPHRKPASEAGDHSAERALPPGENNSAA